LALVGLGGFGGLSGFDGLRAAPLRLALQVAEGGVVREHLHAPRRAREHGVDRVLDQGVPHPGVAQPYGQVGAALTRGEHLLTLEVFEADVPNPGEVLTVRDLPIHGNDDGVHVAVNHRQRFLPARGVLREHEAQRAALEFDEGVAPGDVRDLLRGAQRVCYRHVHDDGCRDRLGRIAAAGAAGELQVHGPGLPARVCRGTRASAVSASGTRGSAIPSMAEALLRDPPGRLGPAELAPIRELLHRVPVVLGAHDVPAGAWAAGGIPHEASTRGDPYDVRRVPRYGGDLDVVAVRDHRHVRPRLHAGPQRTFDLVDLAHAVQLVAGEVEQDEHVRVQLLRDIRDVELVD